MSLEDDVRREIDRKRSAGETTPFLFAPLPPIRLGETIDVTVPFRPIYRQEMLEIMGRVNADEFAGCRRGSLLIAGFESNRPAGFGPKHTIKFEWITGGGWNDHLPVDAEGNRAYPEIDFREIEA